MISQNKAEELLQMWKQAVIRAEIELDEDPDRPQGWENYEKKLN